MSMSKIRIHSVGLVLCQLFSVYNMQGQYLVEEFRPKIKSTSNTASHIVQEDGKIVMLGDYSFVGDSAVSNLLRFHADGQLDTEFIVSSEFIQDFTTDFGRCCGRARVIQGVNTDLVLMADGFKRRVSIIDNSGQFKTDIPTPTPYTQIEHLIKHKDGYVGIVSGGAAQTVFRFHENGEVDASFSRVNYTGRHVADLIIDSENNILILGDLTIGGISRNLIRIDESGILDNSFKNISLSTNFAEIDLFPDDRMVISSDNQLVMLDANANMIESFSPNTNESNIYSSIIDPINDRIIILIDEYPAPVALKALELDGSVSNLFSPNVLSSNSGFINALARILYHNGKFVLTTGFEDLEYDGTIQSFLVFDAEGNVLTDISTKEKLFSVGRVETAVGLEDGSVIVGGKFGHVGNVQVNNMAKLDRDGSVDQTFNTNHPLSIIDEIKEIKISANDQLYIGGFFHDIFDTQRNSLIRMTIEGELDRSFVTNKTSNASSEFLDDFIIMNDRIVACGAYYEDVVAFDLNGNDIPAFNINIFDSHHIRVKSLCKVDDDNFAISGEVLNEEGFLWIMDIDGNIDDSFVRQNEISISSEHIVKIGNDLYRSGHILGGQSSADANFIFKYSLETGEIGKSNFSTYGVGFNRHLLNLNDSTLLISGEFNQFNDSEAHNFVASNFDGRPYERLSFNVSPGIDGYDLQKTIAISDEEVLLLGQFNTINNQPFYSVALMNYTNFSPEVNLNQSYFIPEDTSFYISDLVEIIDLDDEIQVSVGDGDNFVIREDGLIMLQQNFNGTIDLNFSVSDALTVVGPLSMTLEVTPVNDAPEIISQLEVPDILPGEQYEISIESLEVVDVDSEQLTLTVNSGENYSIVGGNSILSNEKFSGFLNVDVTISDGSLTSEEFMFSIQSSHPLGLENLSTLEIYPNPSSDYITLTGVVDIERISIYSIGGENMMDIYDIELNDKGNTIRVNMLPQGIYIANIILKSNEILHVKLKKI